ncbi:hypothetical protein AMATHDRAFT_7344 [Amanita thiersii Skay4041]|uniref:Peptide hydrolase n=1 Tax=Amanita thiersii Skay4041 TaxID=703135 RepID=A0A2A9NGR0_9AGAR|nr:hypothetical protein AMATHDRAFT_7344 [Amanita thiersii Skay4041]
MKTIFLSLACILLGVNVEANTHNSREPSDPPVTSEDLRNAINRQSLMNHARTIEGFAGLSNGTRAFGTAAHNATVDYIKTQLDATGYYDTSLQTFQSYYSEGTAQFSADGEPYVTEWFTYGPAGLANGTIAIVNNLGCNSTDYSEEVSGKIALILRGECDFGMKVALAGAAGASGAVIYNNKPGPVGGGSLRNFSRPDVGPYVPCGSINGTVGQQLVAAINGGATVIGTLEVDAINEPRYTSNVLATTRMGDRANIVMAGGHTDSVPAGPGINDDGSGTISVLEIALQLAKFNVTNAVRFGFWTAEEFGLVGSEHYVASLDEQEKKDIALYLNFDMLASPNFGYFIYDGDGSAFNTTGPAGSDRIEKLYEDFYKAEGVITAPTEFDGRSDYGPFLDVGIPCGGIFTGAEGNKTEQEASWWGGQAGVAYDVCYHQSCDTVENLNAQAWIVNTHAAAHSVATYAMTLDGIPRPRAGSSSKMAKTSSQSQLRACGHELFAM